MCGVRRRPCGFLVDRSSTPISRTATNRAPTINNNRSIPPMCPDHDHAHPIAIDVSDSAEPGPAPATDLIEELAIANHILFDQGVVDAFGHVSVRHNARARSFPPRPQHGAGPRHAGRHRRVHARRRRRERGRAQGLSGALHPRRDLPQAPRRHGRRAQPFARDRAAQRRQRRSAPGHFPHGRVRRAKGLRSSRSARQAAMRPTSSSATTIWAGRSRTNSSAMTSC